MYAAVRVVIVFNFEIHGTGFQLQCAAHCFLQRHMAFVRHFRKKYRGGDRTASKRHRHVRLHCCRLWRVRAERPVKQTLPSHSSTQFHEIVKEVVRKSDSHTTSHQTEQPSHVAATLHAACAFAEGTMWTPVHIGGHIGGHIHWRARPLYRILG